MSPINPYLFFDGNAAEAMRFYERTLNGKLQALMTYADMPGGCAQMPPGSESRVMHACLMFDGGMLMASDAMIGQPWDGVKGCSVALSCASNDEAQRVFSALAEGGQVTMPMDKTFWAERFGMVTDRFGTPWMVNGVQIAV